MTAISDFKLDLSPSGEDFALPEQGFYLFRIEKVRDPKTEPNRYYNPDTARQAGANAGDAYEDPKSGYWVYPTRTSVLIEARPLADSREDFDNLPAVYAYYDLNLSNRSGGYRPAKQLRALIDACFGNTMSGVNAMESLAELEGATFWATLNHQKSKDGAKTYGKILDPTDQAPPRYVQRTEGRGMDRIANSARYDEPEPDLYEDDNLVATDEPQSASLTPIEQSVVDQIVKADDTDFLDFLAKRAHRTGTLTPAVQEALDRKQFAFSRTN